MELGEQELRIRGVGGDVRLHRIEHGLPVVTAADFRDGLYGIGRVQAHDRGMQMELTRLAVKGRLAEHLPAGEALVAIDTTMRRYNLWEFAQRAIETCDPDALAETQAFCQGVNDQFRDHPPAEFALIGYHPEPWTPADCLAVAKVVALVDMDETQGWIKKIIVQMAQHGVSIAMLKEIFPYMIEEPSEAYLDVVRQIRLPHPYVPASVPWAAIPRLRTSSHWMLAGSRTASGKPLLAGSPELDTARLPAIWQEILLRVGDFYCMGVYIPGAPLPALGRTNTLAWSATYACMDAMDYFVEDVRNGAYRRGDRWVPFTVREEVIAVKDGAARVVRFYENEHGVLDGEPTDDGYYLCLAMSMRDAGAHTLSRFARAYRSRTVAEAMDHFAHVDALAFNWGLADSAGNIGYQMSGRCPVRPAGWRGFLPLPGWDPQCDWRGCHDPAKHPRLLNPESGYFGTSNQDLNSLTDVPIQSMPMSDDRAARVAELLAARTDHSVASTRVLQYDVYGKHAERFMALLRPLLPDTPNGLLLRDWDLRYTSDSLAADLFERVYREILLAVFGDHGIGREAIAYLLDNSEIFNMYYGQFDNVLHRETSLWFGGRPRDAVYGDAIERALAGDPVPYGSTRTVVMKNIVYGNMTADFNYGPIEIIGSRGTVSQGAIFKAPGGRIGTFSPAIRFVADLANDDYHSCLAGGACEQPTSPWYTTGIEDWLAGRYKRIQPT